MKRAWLMVSLLLPLSAQAADKPNLELPAKYALGARVRGVFVPRSFFSPYLDAATSMESASLGLEFIYRKATYDVVASLDFMFLPLKSGNWLAKGNPPGLDTHYLEFDNLNFLSTDVSIIGHHTWASVPWLELRYGAGVGLGLVLGDVWMINNGMQCTLANVENTSQCYPRSPTVGDIRLDQPGYKEKLKMTENPNAVDTAVDPHWHKSKDVPPVMAVINILMAVKFRLHPHVSAQVEVGFRNAMFFGAGVHYWF
jgi:hypothetical protein